MDTIKTTRIRLSRQNKLLLKACFLPQEIAASAWQDYQKHLDLDHIDSEAYHLLPLLYQSLSVACPDASELAKLKGIYRKTWYQNYLKLQAVAEIVDCLQSAGIRTMLLNEPALVLSIFGDYGFRAIHDVHVLVPTASALSAINCLIKSGWRIHKSISTMSITFDSCVLLNSPSGQRIVLHWRFLLGMPSKLEYSLIWGNANLVQLPDDLKVHIPIPCHQLLKSCVDLVQSNIYPVLHQLTDVILGIKMLQTTSEWNILVDLAQKSCYAFRLKSTLISVNEILEGLLPAQVIKAFNKIPTTHVEKLEAIADKNHELSFMKKPISRLTQYMRIVNHTSVNNQNLGFMNYLQHIWGLKHSWQIPRYIANRLIRNSN